VPAVVRSLQLDDDQPAGLVQREQVDAAPCVLPFTELLGDDEQVVAERRDVVSEQPLEIGSLVQPERGEPGDGLLLQAITSNLVERHLRLRPSRPARA